MPPAPPQDGLRSRPALTSHGAEAHPTLLGLRHLDVGELADRDQDPSALLVRQRQQAHLGSNRVGKGLLDLLRRLRALEDQLPSRILHPDLALHLLTSAACRANICTSRSA